MSAVNAAGNQRGRPFTKGRSGNPNGKPRGVRHRSTIAAEALLDGEAEALTRKAIELALGGDTFALKLCLERILPARRERNLSVSLPDLRSPKEAGEVSAAILDSVCKGEITLGEAAELARLVAAHLATLESSARYDAGSDTLLG